MNTNVNLEAAVGVLAFLGSAFLLGLAALIFIHAIKTRRLRRARTLGIAAAVGAGLYITLMLIFSFASREKALDLGEEKHFCEVDCHLAYSVINVRRTKTLGPEGAEVFAQGLFYVVTIKTRFDEKTTSVSRGDGLLTPNSRVVTVLDQYGNNYSQSTEGQKALAVSHESGTSLDTALRPGESYTTNVVFDLAATIREPEMLIREGELVTNFIIGHENSLWHKQTKFRLMS